jgi:hypothetical protein
MSKPRVVIEIDTESAAFGETKASMSAELGRILHWLSTNMYLYGAFEGVQKIEDFNGQIVGALTIKRRRGR